MIRLIIRPTAESDIQNTSEWYEEQEQGLGVRFVDELRTVFDRIGTMPLQFPSVWRGARRALLRRFPYAIYFLLRKEKQAIVIAVVHQRRDPRIWRTRVHEEEAG